MSTSLTGRTPANTYKDLLQVSNGNSGIDATLRAVSDGEATDSALQIATNNVKVQPAANSTTTFEVVDSSGGVLFTIDTVNKTVIAASGTKFSGDGSLLTSVVSTGVGGAQSDSVLTIQADATATQAAGDFTDGNDLVFKIGDVIVFRIPNTYAQDLPSGVEGDYILKNIADNWADPSTGWIFDGVDDYVKLEDEPNLDLSGKDFSILSKIFVSDSSHYNTVLSNETFSAGGFTLGVNTSGGIEITFRDSSGNTSTATSTSTINFNKKTLVGVTYNYLTDTARFYINNVFAGEDALSIKYTHPTGTKLLVGGHYFSSAIRFEGKMYDLPTIYNHALTEDEVKERWNNGKPLEFVEPYKYQDASNDDLVTNGDGESGNTATIDGVDIAYGGTTTQDTTYVYSGAYSLKYTGNGTTISTGKLRVLDSNIELRKNYKIEFAALIPSTNTVITSLELKYRDKTNTYVSLGTITNDDTFQTIGISTDAIIKELGSLSSIAIAVEAPVNTANTESFWFEISLVRQGNVLEIKNMGKNGGIAKLGGKTIAFNTYGDPIAVNPNIDARSGVTGAAGTTTDTVLTDSVPRDKVLTRAIIYNNEASDRNINIGSTSGGTDVASDVTITASGYTLLDLKKYFSDSNETTLYISPGVTNNGGAGTWVGTEDLDIRLYFE